MIRRERMADLARWKERDSKKPLILRGARQVGKTTLVMEFAQTYKHTIALNLEKAADLAYFQESKEVGEIVNRIFFQHGIPSGEIGNTLLFIDEIQEAPEAIALLRYFYEDVPELDVISAGSLLEHVMTQVRSFPVGRVEFLYLQPLNFYEYLGALGHAQAQDALCEVSLPDYAHQTMMTLFHEYAMVGGMPAVVNQYLKTKALSDLPPIYESIWDTYKEDVLKYAKNAKQARVIRHVIDTAPFQLDERVKLEKFGRSNYLWREVNEAMQDLGNAQLVQLIRPSTSVELPLLPDLKKHPRLQLLDTGLVNHELGVQADLLTMPDLSPAYKGRLIPHLITQELISLQSTSYKLPHFWVREKAQSSAEVDLVVQHKGKVIPIEIKSGATGSLKSLHQFIDACDHGYAVRIYGGKFSIEEHTTPGTQKPYHLMNLPYYLGTQLPTYLDSFISA